MSDHYVTVSYIDSVVNIFALVNALYLTVPVAAITATKYSDWNDYQYAANSCLNETYSSNSNSNSNSNRL